VLGVAVFAVLYSFQQNDDMNDKTETPSATISEYKGAAPQVIDTNDALTRFVENRTSDGLVRESDVHLPQGINWNEEVLVALQFDALQAKTFREVTREVVDGEESYVIELLGVAEGCSTIQINTVRVAFIVQQTSQNTSLPVIIRTVPNTASCDL